MKLRGININRGKIVNFINNHYLIIPMDKYEKSAIKIRKAIDQIEVYRYGNKQVVKLCMAKSIKDGNFGSKKELLDHLWRVADLTISDLHEQFGGSNHQKHRTAQYNTESDRVRQKLEEISEFRSGTQLIQICIAKYLRIKGLNFSTKDELLEYIWDVAKDVISDLDEYFDNSGNNVQTPDPLEDTYYQI